MLANRRLYNVLVLLVLLGGLAIRWLYVAQLDNKLWWVDEVDYLALGTSIASGDGFVKANGEPTAFRPPGYPLVLAGLSKIGIDTIAEIRIAQVFISTATLFILFLLSLKIAGPVAAPVSAIAAAGYPYFIFGAGTLYPLTFFSCALVASVYFILGKKKWHIALAGLLMGLAILMRTSAVVLAFSVMVWLFFMMRQTIKKYFSTAIIYGLTLTIVVAPWLIRNYTVFGKSMLSSNGGRNLWLGNNPKSTASTGSDIAMPPELEARIDAASEVEADAIYAAVANEFIKANPWHVFKLSVQKGVAFWRLDPSPTTEGYPRYKNIYSMFSVVSVAPVFLLAILGFFLADREQKKNMLLWILFALSFTALHAVYISKVRFRLPLDYFFIVMAGSAVAALCQRSTLIQKLSTRFSAGFLYDHDSSTLSISASHQH